MKTGKAVKKDNGKWTIVNRNNGKFAKSNKTEYKTRKAAEEQIVRSKRRVVR